MRPGLHEPISVLCGYSKDKKTFKPLIVTWQGVDYRLGDVDFYHKTKQGLTTLQNYSVSDEDKSVYFKLLLDGTSLNWTLEEYMMAGANEAHYA